jgi:PIN domain nuclease of toxin-antitoxin system
MLFFSRRCSAQRRRARLQMKTAPALSTPSAPLNANSKGARGKLALGDGCDGNAVIVAAGFTPLAMTIAHGVGAARLAFDHCARWDRQIAAQALTERLTLVGNDPISQT